MIHMSCYALILDGSPTALSILSYHSPILVFSTKSLPACKYRIGLSTPNTARSAKFGFEPPVQNKTNNDKKIDFRNLTSNYARTCAKYDRKMFSSQHIFSSMVFPKFQKLKFFHHCCVETTGVRVSSGMQKYFI